MAEASASCKSKTQKGLTVSKDVVVARQQLRDEDDDHHQKKRKKEGENHKRRSNSKLERCDATCAKIHETFGNDEVVTKQKKYRSLGSIYMTTMPIIVVQGQPLKENLM